MDCFVNALTQHFLGSLTSQVPILLEIPLKEIVGVEDQPQTFRAVFYQGGTVCWDYQELPQGSCV